ncbi:MAG TPA: AfsR/SARP family transcriptional regulator [Actinophytocola sp.]|uniref:AfsR/SARP family transcriptional regulator n=1 Tax=Actinophytocola sp. TaxID=1872138 RepID=UPI002DDCF646|nr:AfsR/SARP family transcriptional regulator [Actinophytocola sp.]HEV2783340.1 AfsR/SARP family transcriptional regulator [Actinophytocola sp.]
MRVSVLGALEVEENGRIITPTASKMRQVIALLAVHAGQVVTVRTLTDELWGPTPPRSPVQSVQTYVLHLRKLIDDAHPDDPPGLGKEILATRHSGYLLDLPPEGLDVHRYEQLADAGQRALSCGDYERASRLLNAALAMWRGPALVDVQAGPPLGVKISGLEESRLGVQEARIDADLRLGRHNQILGELGELNARYPMHETVCAQYMTALYRAGRTWRALEVFRALREALVSELGLEPSGRVRQLQHAILNADPALDPPGDRVAQLAAR